MNDMWDEIIADYKKARGYLWGTKHKGTWWRDELNGYSHLWKAYHAAANASEKNYVWYARILFMMAKEQNGMEKHEIFHRFLVPCIEAYEKAKQSENIPATKEVEIAQAWYDEYNYLVNYVHTEETRSKCYSLLEDIGEELDFHFHDSKIVSFDYDNKDTARLTLDYDGTTVTFEFLSVDTVAFYADCDNPWVYDAYCYHIYYSDTRWVFELDQLKVQCGDIRIVGYHKEG